MAEVYVRVDDRLLHSEVLYGCIPTWRPELVIIASRLPWLDTVDLGAAPDEVAFRVADPTDVARMLVPNMTILVVFGTLSDVRLAQQAGFEAGSVVLANRSRRGAGWTLTSTFYLDDDERNVLEELLKAGIVVHAQTVPASEAIKIDSSVLVSMTPISNTDEEKN